MVAIGEHAGRKVVAVISDMNQPLGHAVGNALELREALETLRGGGPHDFREHCLEVGAHLLLMAGKAKTLKGARVRLELALQDGSAFAKFKQLVAAQGGDVRVLENPDLLPKAALVELVSAPRAGYLAEVNAREVGLAAVALGAGRAQKGDPIDHAVGVIIRHKVGDKIKKGEPLFVVHANDKTKLAAARARILAAHKFSGRPERPLPLFYKVIKSK
jgi:pyrimidine-nucleoside phosphorylase